MGHPILWPYKTFAGEPTIRVCRRSTAELHWRSPPPVAGFEPASSRLTGEVSQIFTTGNLCPRKRRLSRPTLRKEREGWGTRLSSFLQAKGLQLQIHYRGTSDQRLFPLLWLSYGITMPAGFHTCARGLDEVTLIFTTGNIEYSLLQSIYC